MERELIRLMILLMTTGVELYMRMQEQNPQAFESEAEAMLELEKKIDQLRSRPANYLQTWKP